MAERPVPTSTHIWERVMQTYSKMNCSVRISHVVLCVVFVLLTACGGSSGDEVVASSETGSVALTLTMKDFDNAAASRQIAQNGFECETDEYSIATIVVQVFDENDELLAEEPGERDQEAHEEVARFDCRRSD